MRECEKDNLDELDVVKTLVKKLKLQNSIHFDHLYKPRLTFETRKNVWKFWDDNSDESTLTTQLAKLRVSRKPKCQQDLDYNSTVSVVTIRKCLYYQSIWKVTSTQLLGLYQEYRDQFPDMIVSKGTFFNLKPFYIRNASNQDIEMCLCKLHLHIQWAINSLLQLYRKLNLEVLSGDYRVFKIADS